MKYYFKTHEWIEEVNGKDAGTEFYMGISSYACDQLGDIVFIEAKDSGDSFDKEESLTILESVKAVGDIYAPAKCTLVETNPELVDSPESLKADNWIVKISLDSETQIKDLDTVMTEEDYKSKQI